MALALGGRRIGLSLAPGAGLQDGQEVRPLLETVDAHLRDTLLTAATGYSKRVKDLEMRLGITACVPVLAGWAGLGSGPRLLYKAPMFDQ